MIGRGGRSIAADDAHAHVAGYTVGQDISERTIQWQGQPAQFSVGKSYAGFAPTGPVLATLDEFANPDRLRISCTITDRTGTSTPVQDSFTDQLIFSVGEIISRLSDVVELLPGDLIFTGPPPGVGSGLKPPRFLVEATCSSPKSKESANSVNAWSRHRPEEARRQGPSRSRTVLSQRTAPASCWGSARTNGVRADPPAAGQAGLILLCLADESLSPGTGYVEVEERRSQVDLSTTATHVESPAVDPAAGRADGQCLLGSLWSPASTGRRRAADRQG